MAERSLVIAAGGTGGHMFPAQALAEAMLARGWNVKLSTDSRGARYTQRFPAEVDIEEVNSATFSRGGFSARVKAPFEIAAGVMVAKQDMRKAPPTVVVGFGGYPSIPALAAATWLKLPRMIHEQNGVLGRVNTFFSRRVDAIACGTWPTDLPDDVKGTDIGNPVRSAILAEAGAPYTPPGDGALNLLVIGGSQGARILSEVVPQALKDLPTDLRSRLRVAHQARDEDLTRAHTFYRHAGIDAEVLPFFMDIPQRMAAAQLVISRAGASSVADLSIIGRPAILVPYAAATGDHQTANARSLVEAGGAVMVSEAHLTHEGLTEQIAAVLQQPETAARMAAGALSQGRPDATERLAAMVEKLAEKGAKT